MDGVWSCYSSRLILSYLYSLVFGGILHIRNCSSLSRSHSVFNQTHSLANNHLLQSLCSLNSLKSIVLKWLQPKQKYHKTTESALTKLRRFLNRNCIKHRMTLFWWRKLRKMYNAKLRLKPPEKLGRAETKNTSRNNNLRFNETENQNNSEKYWKIVNLYMMVAYGKLIDDLHQKKCTWKWCKTKGQHQNQNGKGRKRRE